MKSVFLLLHGLLNFGMRVGITLLKKASAHLHLSSHGCRRLNRPSFTVISKILIFSGSFVESLSICSCCIFPVSLIRKNWIEWLFNRLIETSLFPVLAWHRQRVEFVKKLVCELKFLSESQENVCPTRTIVRRVLAFCTKTIFRTSQIPKVLKSGIVELAIIALLWFRFHFLRFSCKQTVGPMTVTGPPPTFCLVLISWAPG